MNSSLVTFVIPTLGRESLQKSLDSLRSQTHPDWSACVMYDGCSPFFLPQENKIFFTSCKKQSGAGEVRNRMLDLICSDPNCAKWVAFLDDDDYILETYVSKIFEYQKKGKRDVILFSMKRGNRILPKPGSTTFRCTDVGISYAVKIEFIKQHNMRFQTKTIEDFNFLRSCEEAGGDVFISNDVQYIVEKMNRWQSSKKKIKMI